MRLQRMKSEQEQSLVQSVEAAEAGMQADDRLGAPGVPPQQVGAPQRAQQQHQVTPTSRYQPLVAVPQQQAAGLSPGGSVVGSAAGSGATPQQRRYEQTTWQDGEDEEEAGMYSYNLPDPKQVCQCNFALSHKTSLPRHWSASRQLWAGCMSSLPRLCAYVMPLPPARFMQLSPSSTVRALRSALAPRGTMASSQGVRAQQQQQLQGLLARLESALG
jgi:hypothetical protein